MDDQDLFSSDERPETEESHEEFSYPKSIIGGVLVLSLFVLVIVFWQMREHFTLEIPTSDNGVQDISNLSLLDLEDEALQGQDSDEDGLTDYQELRIYGTSPFIADSDSDGILDPEEVALGQDPNCPEGEDCFRGLVEEVNSTITAPDFTDPSLLQDVVSDPDQIRSLLIQNGADPFLVESLDDQSLQILAQEAFESFDAPTQESIDLLSGLQAPQIRELLIGLGLSDTTLDEISDEDLLDLFRQVATEQEALLQEGGDEENLAEE